MSLPKFLTQLYSEILDQHGEVNNFASLLRCSCLIYRSGNATLALAFDDRHTAVRDAAE